MGESAKPLPASGGRLTLGFGGFTLGRRAYRCEQRQAPPGAGNDTFVVTHGQALADLRAACVPAA